MKAAADAGLMTGYPGGFFSPAKAISRAECVTVINRLRKRGPLLDRPAARWADVPEYHWAYGQVQEASLGHQWERELDPTQRAHWLQDLP